MNKYNKFTSSNNISYRLSSMIYDGILLELLSAIVLVIGILKFNVLHIYMCWVVLLSTLGSLIIFNSYKKHVKYVLNFEINNYNKKYISILKKSFLKINTAAMVIHIIVGFVYSIKMMYLYIEFAGDRFKVFSLSQNDVYYKIILLIIFLTIYLINFVVYIKSLSDHERRLKEIG